MNKVKVLVMDVDGTLTNGSIYVGECGEVMKVFDVKDGYAIKNILNQYNIVPIVITGRKSKIVEYRCNELGIHELYQGIDNKLCLLEKLVNRMGIEISEVAYIGDDMNDIECMKKVGFSGCPYDGSEAVKRISDYVCTKQGGKGAVREFIEWLINER